MTNNYKIEKPTSDLNYLTNGIKYVVLGIILFFASWIAVPLFVSQNRPYRLNSVFELIFENPVFFSIGFACLVIGFLIYRTWKKYKFGEVYSIEFNDSKKILEISYVNLANNQEKKRKYHYKNLSFELLNKEDALFGKQRVLLINNNSKKVHEINFDRTAWCRNEQIDQLIEKIKTGHNNV